MSGKRNQSSSPIGSPSSGNISDSKDQERFLPIANVSRIMKKSLPTNAKISKEAKETVQECVSEFISFITGEASDKCQREKRKTINGDDLLWAMTTLGFENYVSPLKFYLNKYRETEGDKNSSFPRQELDQSPPNYIISSANNEINYSLSSAHSEIYSLGAQVTAAPKSSSYGDQNLGSTTTAYNMSWNIRENGDGNGNNNTAMAATYLHHGIGW